MDKEINLAEIYETIAAMIDDHVLVCSKDGAIIYSNRAIQTSLGYTDAELKEKTVIDLIAEVHLNKARAIFGEAPHEPCGWEEFLCHGRNGLIRLYAKIFIKGEYLYIFGNEKYAEYDRIKQKLDTEISNAVKIHKRSLPVNLPQSDKISFGSLYIPAEELGGDLFDVFKVDNGLLDDYFEQYVCYVADVSGHGLDSAMLAMFVKDTIRSYFRLKHNPGQLLSPKEIMLFFIEQYRKEGYPEEYLVCLVIAVFDLKTKELTYCNAGIHTSPLLVTQEERITELGKVGFPITTALNADLFEYEDTTYPLMPTLTLFFMSDGLPEQRAGDEFYEDRLKKLFPEIHPKNPSEMIQRINEDFTDFLGSEKLRDDITLVVAKLLQSPNKGTAENELKA